MALRWDWKDKMGDMTICQKHKDGTQATFKVNLYFGNCMALAIYEYEKDGEKWHQLYWFLADEQHLKNILKDSPKFFDEIKSIRLNMYYKSSETLQRYLVKLGIRVTAYYKEPKKPKEKKIKINKQTSTTI